MATNQFMNVDQSAYGKRSIHLSGEPLPRYLIILGYLDIVIYRYRCTYNYSLYLFLFRFCTSIYRHQSTYIYSSIRFLW